MKSIFVLFSTSLSRGFLLLLLVLTIVLPCTTFAYSSNTTMPEIINVSSQQSKSLEQAVKDIKKKTGGRVLSAKTIKLKGKPVHRIKVLMPSNKIRIFHIDLNPEKNNT